MGFVVLVIICSLQPELPDGCLKFVDRPVQHYATLENCKGRAREMVDSIKGDLPRLQQRVPGPWEWRVYCQMEVINEVGYG
jgi:hypothetical protein